MRLRHRCAFVGSDGTRRQVEVTVAEGWQEGRAHPGRPPASGHGQLAAAEEYVPIIRTQNGYNICAFFQAGGQLLHFGQVQALKNPYRKSS